MTAIILIIIYIAFISLGLPDPLLGATWPIMHQDFGVSLETVGILSMIVSCGTIVSSFFSGKILHRFGTGKVTFVSILMTACALLGLCHDTLSGPFLANGLRNHRYPTVYTGIVYISRIATLEQD